MIEYFVRPMAGIRTAITFDELVAYRTQRGMRLPHPPAGRGRRADRRRARSTCRRPARARSGCVAAVQVHPHRPAHAGQDADRYGTTATCRSSRWRSPTRSPSRSGISMPTCVQVDEANLPGSPDEWQWARRGDQPRARRREDGAGACICASATTAASRSRRARWARLIGLPQRAARRSHRDGDSRIGRPRSWRCSATCGPEIGFGLGVVDIKSTEIETADADRPRDRARRTLLGPGRIKYVHPGLRLLDAQAHHRRRQDPRAGAGARSPSRTRGLRDEQLPSYCAPVRIATITPVLAGLNPSRANRSLTRERAHQGGEQPVDRAHRARRAADRAGEALGRKISAKQIGIASAMK